MLAPDILLAAINIKFKESLILSSYFIRWGLVAGELCMIVKVVNMEMLVSYFVNLRIIYMIANTLKRSNWGQF